MPDQEREKYLKEISSLHAEKFFDLLFPFSQHDFLL